MPLNPCGWTLHMYRTTVQATMQNAEFFKRVRARYYVFSGVEPSREVFNALLEAKKTWENKEQGILRAC